VFCARVQYKDGTLATVCYLTTSALVYFLRSNELTLLRLWETEEKWA
jgi:hypothetical protein